MSQPATHCISRENTELLKLRETLHLLERGYTSGHPSWGLATGFAELDRALAGGKLPSHCVHEITGGQAYGFTLRLLRQLNDGRPCLWCRKASAPHVPYGPAFTAQGVNAENIIFVQCNCREDFLWSMEESLRSGAAALVVGEPHTPLNLTTSRRLQLAAETGGSMGLIISKEENHKAPHNALFSRWRICASPTKLSEKFAWNVELLRMRGTPPGHWRVAETGYHD